MKLFDPNNWSQSAEHRRIYAMYELISTVVDFMAALLFVIGSVLFFKEETVYVGTWLFLVGSILFGFRPTIKLVREIVYIRAGHLNDIDD